MDLTVKAAIEADVSSIQPSSICLAAARVGGILANSTYTAEFIYDNLQVQLNVIKAAVDNEVPMLLFLGASCIYPKHAPQPISEDSLLTGPLDPTNEPYAIAKIAGAKLGEASKAHHGRQYGSAAPPHLSGPTEKHATPTTHVPTAPHRSPPLARPGLGPPRAGRQD